MECVRCGEELQIFRENLGSKRYPNYKDETRFHQDAECITNLRLRIEILEDRIEILCQTSNT